MSSRRGSYVRVLPGSAATIRSITAEEEEMPSKQKTDREIEALVMLAVDQGWDVRPNGNGLKWLHPDGETVVHTPMRVIGRGHMNVRTELSKKGLDISSLSQKKKSIEEPLSMKEMEEAAEKSDLPKVAEMTRNTKSMLEEEGLSDFDESLANYLNECTNSLRRFVRDQNLAGCDHTDLQKEIDKVTTESLGILSENEKLQTRVETLETRISSIGTELNEERRKAADALERANKAEQKLRMLRQALSLDD